MANGQINYYPPNNVRSMEHDLMPLAAYYANPGDAILVANGMQQICTDFYAPIQTSTNHPFVFVSPNHLPAEFELKPWGLNKNLCWQLSKWGATHLPSESNVSEVRRLASRQTACELLEQLKQQLTHLPICGDALFCKNLSDINLRLADKRKYILKAPLSSSGRGLRFAHDQLKEPLIGWCSNTIQTQGGVVVETFYDKITDFAAEFEALPNGEIQYKGLSLFATSTRCSYLANLVASQTELQKRIFQAFPQEAFSEIINAITRLLSATYNGHYVGPFGIDMMLCNHQGSNHIHPCVEINLRNTMGMFAIHLAKHIAPHKNALFSIQYAHTPEALQSWAKQLETPITSSQAQLISGCKILTPILHDTHYAAFLQIVDCNSSLFETT